MTHNKDLTFLEERNQVAKTFSAKMIKSAKEHGTDCAVISFSCLHVFKNYPQSLPINYILFLQLQLIFIVYFRYMCMHV